MKYPRISLLLAAALTSTYAAASADCPAYPKSEWMKEADAKAKLEQAGYKIKVFKVTGNCYELYGHDKAGKKVEIYFDAKTMKPVKEEKED